MTHPKSEIAFIGKVQTQSTGFPPHHAAYHFSNLLKLFLQDSYVYLRIAIMPGPCLSKRFSCSPDIYLFFLFCVF